MNHAVDWLPDAENDLAAIWITTDDQNAVTGAAEWFDRRLASSPLSFGESRELSVRRVGHYPPLGIEFEIIEDDEQVLVQAVWLIE